MERVRREIDGRRLRVAGLFAGVGGFELGLARAGHRTVLLCENWDAAAAVLRSRFPDVHLVGDVRGLRDLPEGVELVCAGFPCQDLSQAGRTRGIEGARSGLVAELFRLLDRRRVPWVLLENVPFMLQLARGRAMEVVIRALEERGYRWAYRVVDSLAFLPQRRHRVFVLASLDDDPADVLLADDVPVSIPETDLDRLAHGFYWTEGLRGLGWAVDAVPTLKTGSAVGIPSPPAILMPDGAVITPDIRDAERLQGFPAGWTAPAGDVARPSFRWSLVGNAVTVPVAEWLGRRLRWPGRYDRGRDRLPFSGPPWPQAARGEDGLRIEVDVGPWPVHRRRPHLHHFLQHPGEPLSARATRGFLSRAYRAKLRFPAGFLARLERHLVRLEREAAAPAGTA